MCGHNLEWLQEPGKEKGTMVCKGKKIHIGGCLEKVIKESLST